MKINSEKKILCSEYNCQFIIEIIKSKTHHREKKWQAPSLQMSIWNIIGSWHSHLIWSQHFISKTPCQEIILPFKVFSHSLPHFNTRYENTVNFLYNLSFECFIMGSYKWMVTGGKHVSMNERTNEPKKG